MQNHYTWPVKLYSNEIFNQLGRVKKEKGNHISFHILDVSYDSVKDFKNKTYLNKKQLKKRTSHQKNDCYQSLEIFL